MSNHEMSRSNFTDRRHSSLSIPFGQEARVERAEVRPRGPVVGKASQSPATEENSWNPGQDFWVERSIQVR